MHGSHTLFHGSGQSVPIFSCLQCSKGFEIDIMRGMEKNMESITNKTHTLVKKAVQLKMKKYRDLYGMFLLEGIRSAEEAYRCGNRNAVCFVTRKCLETERVSLLPERTASFGWIWYEVSEAVMDKISDTEHSQGIAVIVRKDMISASFPSGRLTGRFVLLDQIQDPGNLGTIIRTAAASACRGVLLTEGCADAFGEKTVRSSMGSIFRIPIYENLTEENLEQIRKDSGLPLIGTSLDGGVSYREAGRLENGIFVFGNEGSGIRREILSMCGIKIFIPMAASVESLNVSAAAAVILFHNFY